MYVHNHSKYLLYLQNAHMAKKVRISDIAKIAGVSAGTVDRVVHGRGNVSAESRQAVEAALKQTGYTPNLHVSSIAVKKSYQIAVVIPQTAPGEYWAQIKEGLEKGFDTFSDFDINHRFFHYDQFDINSCAEAFKAVMDWNPSAVILGPTFSDETLVFTASLDEALIPYVYVDSVVENTYPVASYCVHQQSCGHLIAKLICQITPSDSEYVIFQAERKGNASANNTILRKNGFRKYFEERGESGKIRLLIFSATDKKANEKRFKEFFTLNPKVKGAVVLSSRGSLVAECLDACGIKDMRLVCLDNTQSNIESLQNGHIDYIICQRPVNQGYLAVRSAIMHLLYAAVQTDTVHMPLDIITKENIEFYKELLNI